MPNAKEDELLSLLRGQGEVIQEVYSVLEAEEKKDALVRASILSSLEPGGNRIPGVNMARIFHEEDIRRVCVKYRLRFLPAGRFKGAIPHEAVIAVRQLEAKAGATLKGYKIMAPAKRFRLCDTDADPFLFVPVGGDCYYLVHKWGRDMHPLRAVWTWPVRNWLNLVATTAVLAALLGAIMPTAWITPVPDAPWWGGYRFGAFFWAAMVVGAASSFSWFAFYGQFSDQAWKSKTFN